MPEIKDVIVLVLCFCKVRWVAQEQVSDQTWDDLKEQISQVILNYNPRNNVCMNMCPYLYNRVEGTNLPYRSIPRNLEGHH